MKFSDLIYGMKFPIFIPTSSYLTQLLIKKAHDVVYHQRVVPTLTQLRSMYWIPRGRQIVKKVISKCALCNLYDVSPYKPSPAPDLPHFRVEVVAPFQNVGTDHVGPLFVRNIYSDSKETHKCYISIFSCCVTRMVHFELQPDLEADSTIRGMKRTFARVGTPNLLISDNHKTYRSEKAKTFAQNNGIKWRHILELSPNWGGFYERMNSIIKRALRKTLRNAHLNYEELETILVEIESVINSRPLSYVQHEELSEPLTPAHLMFGRRLKTHIVQKDTPLDDKVSPTKRIKYVNGLLASCWKKFSSEYLTSLRERKEKRGVTPNIVTGQVVVIKDKIMPRNSWSLGKVIRVIRSTDGIAKGAVLKTKGGTMKRPMSLLCPVEMEPSEETQETPLHRSPDITDLTTVEGHVHK